jgi:hypothetical protein
MKTSSLIAITLAFALAGSVVHAQQAAAPAGSSGQCKDGSYTSVASKRGACRGHKGVKEWYAAAPAKDAKAKTVKAAPAAPAPMASGSMMHKGMPVPPAAAAPGGGAGMVWVNDSSKVYHCQGDKWYGKTKHGEYMSEAAAKAKGNHGEHGKSCTP